MVQELQELQLQEYNTGSHDLRAAMARPKHKHLCRPLHSGPYSQSASLYRKIFGRSRDYSVPIKTPSE
jgi:hypothetical protein